MFSFPLTCFKCLFFEYNANYKLLQYFISKNINHNIITIKNR